MTDDLCTFEITDGESGADPVSEHVHDGEEPFNEDNGGGETRQHKGSVKDENVNVDESPSGTCTQDQDWKKKHHEVWLQLEILKNELKSKAPTKPAPPKKKKTTAKSSTRKTAKNTKGVEEHPLYDRRIMYDDSMYNPRRLVMEDPLPPPRRMVMGDPHLVPRRPMYEDISPGYMIDPRMRPDYYPMYK